MLQFLRNSTFEPANKAVPSARQDAADTCELARYRNLPKTGALGTRVAFARARRLTPDLETNGGNQGG